MYNNSDFAIIENKTDGWKFPRVVSLEHPFIVGDPVCIWTKKADKVNEMLDDIAQGRKVAAKVKGYNIFVFPAGTLTHEEAGAEQLGKVLRGMADFFLTEKAERYPDVYERFKELW